jgi:hypothetical protein
MEMPSFGYGPYYKKEIKNLLKNSLLWSWGFFIFGASMKNALVLIGIVLGSPVPSKKDEVLNRVLH